MSERTPTPWEHHVDAFKVVHAPTSYMGDWTTVALCSTSEQASANAAFIVRACNAHDELVETLAWVRKNYAAGNTKEINARIDDALAKARGESA